MTRATAFRIGAPVRIHTPGRITDGWIGTIVDFQETVAGHLERALVQIDGREIRITVGLHQLVARAEPGIRAARAVRNPAFAALEA